MCFFPGRRQISQYDAVKAQSSHLLEECKSQETWKLPREKPECQTPVPAIEKEEESEQIRVGGIFLRVTTVYWNPQFIFSNENIEQIIREFP